MSVFTFDTDAQFRKALAIVKRLGVDFEADPEARTIITDELTSAEWARVHAAHNA